MRSWTTGALLLAALLVLVAVPVLARRGGDAPPKGSPSVIVVSPHNEQIRLEFGRAFSRWHEREYGTPATVIWNSPGGTSEIRKMLVASATAALRDGTPTGGDADVLFGGGSYEFGALARPLALEVNGEKRSTTVLEPLPLPREWLQQAYGETSIGGRPLYHPEGYWYGAALSAFGIVYNTEVLARLGIPPPTGWSALADARLFNWTALVNPAQSGSVATAFETILLREGWNDGWRILRRAAANARSISASATRAPIEVAQGEAAEAFAIDFYGRFQQQAVARGGSPGRVGYMDPAGRTAVDPDPIALLRGAPNREMAERFIRFVLSPDGQRLWQLRAGEPGGPEQFELRRLCASRVVFAAEHGRFTDPVDPWSIASEIANANPNVRDFVAPLFVAMALDNRALLREAWTAIRTHPEYPKDGRVLSAAEARDPRLRAMLEAFDALPVVPGPAGARLSLDDEASLAVVRKGWIEGGWAGAGLWDPNDAPVEVLRRVFAAFFRAQFERVVALAEGAP
jgi:ABC-type Fe3+ transport system substrate-binding protein